jgi:hypothetical protein
MKLICTIIGSLIVLIIVILTPWPDFILGVANRMLAVPEAAGDVVYEYLVKTFMVTVSYIAFPLVGGVIGFITGYIINRKFE